MFLPGRQFNSGARCPHEDPAHTVAWPNSSKRLHCAAVLAFEPHVVGDNIALWQATNRIDSGAGGRSVNGLRWWRSFLLSVARCPKPARNELFSQLPPNAVAFLRLHSTPHGLHGRGCSSSPSRERGHTVAGWGRTKSRSEVAMISRCQCHSSTGGSV